MAVDRRLARAVFSSICRALRSVPAVSAADPIDLGAWRGALRPFAFVESRPSARLSRALARSEADALVRQDGTVDTRELLAAVKETFRSTPSSGEAIDRGIEGVRQANKAARTARHSATAVTDGIEVAITTALVPGTQYQFVYRVRVRSMREKGQVQLCKRHIRVSVGGPKRGLTDAEAAAFGGGVGGAPRASVIETPRDAPGVVGQMPVLGSGQTFEYYSNTSWLDCPWGSIAGSFGLFELDTKRTLRVEIPEVEFEDVDTVDGVTARRGS